MLATHARVMAALEQGPCMLGVLAQRLNTTSRATSRWLFEMKQLGYTTVTGEQTRYVYSINPSYSPPAAPRPRQRPPSSIWEVADRCAQETQT